MREAHPGPGVETYHRFDEKLDAAQRYKHDEQIPWRVLVDDLEGTVHQVYGTLADPAYLIDADGRVAFYNMWTHAPNLHMAISTLMEQNQRGVVNGGIDHVPHMLPALTHGWKGVRRGLPQSYLDFELAAPASAAGLWLGYQFRKVLAPVTLRSKPLPFPVKPVLAAGAGVAGFVLIRRAIRG